MRFRQILLVHPSRAFRGLIKKFLFAEFNDLKITESDTTEEALHLADQQAFNALLAGGDANPEVVLDFMTNLKKCHLNERTPFIVLCELECSNMQQEQLSECFEHVVHIRIRPSDLIRKIDEVCNPRQMRRDERYYLPNSTLSVTGGGLQVEAKLINISRGGVLVELNTNAPELLMKSDIILNLKAATPSRTFDIKNLKSKLLRLNVASWHADNTPVSMRVTFLFGDLEPRTQDLLQVLLHQAQKDQRQETGPAEAN